MFSLQSLAIGGIVAVLLLGSAYGAGRWQQRGNDALIIAKWEASVTQRDQRIKELNEKIKVQNIAIEILRKAKEEADKRREQAQRDYQTKREQEAKKIADLNSALSQETAKPSSCASALDKVREGLQR